MTDDEQSRRLRVILRRPAAAEQAEELAAIPTGFDKIFSKPYFAHQMRLSGRDWHYVAAKMGYKSARGAEAAVRRWLTKNVEGGDLPNTRAMLQAEAVRLDLDRLDALLSVYWGEAMAGDLASANYVLRVIAQRARYISPETAVAVTNQFATLVIGGSEEEYVGALVKARESLGPGGAGQGDQHRVLDLDPVRE